MKSSKELLRVPLPNFITDRLGFLVYRKQLFVQGTWPFFRAQNSLISSSNPPLNTYNQKIYQGPSAENLNGEILKATNFLRSQDLMSILEAIDGHQRLILIRHFMRLISKINQSERVRATLLGNVIDFKNNIERKIEARSING
jgi:hypothetical protein